MTIPDTFAGGKFGLPLKVAKIVRQASGSDGERKAANNLLKKYGYFADRAGVVWDIDKVPEFAKDIKDGNNTEKTQ